MNLLLNHVRHVMSRKEKKQFPKQKDASRSRAEGANQHHLIYELEKDPSFFFLPSLF